MAETTEQSQDVYGHRYQRCWLDGGIQVWVMVEENAILVEPGFTERVTLAAQLCAEELRSERVKSL